VSEQIGAVRLRPFQLDDCDRVIALWRDVGLHLSPSDSRAGLARKLERDPELFLVAEGDDAGATIVGAVMGCYDGRRGWINHLAVAVAAQGCGLGRRLIEEVERRLRALGCEKVNLLIEPANAQVQSFYEHLGYARDELVFMEKWLTQGDC
jgi:ribosomal protein S18 acetylase RimI-like enzyme